MRIYTNITIFFLALRLLQGGTILAGEGAVALPPSAGLADYVKTGLLNHPGLKSDYQKYRAALHRVPQVKSLPDPMVSYTHFFEQVQTRTGPQENIYSITQTIPWMGKLRLQGSIASREAEAALRRYEKRRLQLIREISAAYYDYAYLGKESAITRKTLDLLRRLEESVDEQVRAGGEYSASLRLEVEKGKTEDRLSAVQSARARKSAALETSIGRKAGGTSLLPWPALADDGASREGRDRLKAQLLAQNPGLKAIREQLAAADDRVRLAKRSPIPDPTIGVNYIDIGGSGEDAVGMTLGFRIPLGWKKYKAERMEAEAIRQAAREQLTEQENTLLEELAVALADFDEAVDRAALFRDKLLPAAEEAVKVSETSYSAGKESILEVIDSERTLLELQKTYWRAVANSRARLIELRTLTGTEKP